MEQKKIEVSYLLDKKEYVEKSLLLQQQARKKWITALCAAAGVFFILQAFFQMIQQADLVYSILSVLLGLMIAVFYDFFILRVLPKKARKTIMKSIRKSGLPTGLQLKERSLLCNLISMSFVRKLRNCGNVWKQICSFYALPGMGRRFLSPSVY